MRFRWGTRELTHSSKLDDSLFTVMSPVEFTADGRDYKIVPPMRHDFATVPWFVRWFIGKVGIHSHASVAHDGGFQHNVGRAIVHHRPAGIGAEWQQVAPGSMSRVFWDRIWFWGFVAAIDEYPRASWLQKCLWWLQAHAGYWTLRAFADGLFGLQTPFLKSYWRT